jgi:hypothetical protein
MKQIAKILLAAILASFFLTACPPDPKTPHAPGVPNPNEYVMPVDE